MTDRAPGSAPKKDEEVEALRAELLAKENEISALRAQLVDLKEWQCERCERSIADIDACDGECDAHHEHSGHWVCGACVNADAVLAHKELQGVRSKLERLMSSIRRAWGEARGEYKTEKPRPPRPYRRPST